MLAGAGKSKIEVDYPIEGFTGERDPLYARVVVLGEVVVVVVDLTALPVDLVAELRYIVGRACVVKPKNVFVCASHTFSAPHIADGFRDAVTAAVTRAAESAARGRRPGRLRFGRGISRVNVNRDIQTTDGWWLGANENGISDQDVMVLRVDGLDGDPIAVLVNYAVQSSIMNESVLDGGGKLVTGDLAGAACRHVEGVYPGSVALFLVGAAGDQGPYLTSVRRILDSRGNVSVADAGEAGHLLIDLLGERLGGSVVSVAERSCPVAVPLSSVVHGSVEVGSQVAPASFRDLHPTTSYEFRPSGFEVVPFSVMRLGDIVLIGLQAELSSVTGLSVKARSPFSRTLIMTMVNGGAKYMADAASYDRITYAAMNSRYARGSAETVANTVLALLSTLP
jgi:hypothetical protein